MIPLNPYTIELMGIRRIYVSLNFKISLIITNINFSISKLTPVIISFGIIISDANIAFCVPRNIPRDIKGIS